MPRANAGTAAAKKAAAAKNKEETQVTADTTAAPVEAAATTETETKVESPIDLTAFESALDAALAESDASTGTIPEGALHGVIKAYQELDGAKAKSAARRKLEAGVKAGLEPNGDVVRARALHQVSNSITTAKGAAKSEKAPVDPTEAFVQQAVALQLAYSHVTQNVPEGVSEDWKDRASKLAGETVEDLDKLAKYSGEGEAPAVSDLAKRALKLAQGKATGGKKSSGPRAPFTGTRHDISKHIAEAFAGEEVGKVLTVAQIVGFKSTEYGDDQPSPGAVSARLFPKSGKCTLEGIEAVEASGDQPKGARKSA